MGATAVKSLLEIALGVKSGGIAISNLCPSSYDRHLFNEEYPLMYKCMRQLLSTSEVTRWHSNVLIHHIIHKMGKNGEMGGVKKRGTVGLIGASVKTTR